MATIGDHATSLLQTIGNIPDFVMRLGTNYKTKSLIDVAQIGNVEPLTVISEDCLNLEYMPDVLQSVLSIFTGYYLRAAALSSSIGGVKVVRALDRLNPDRKFNELMIGTESLDSAHTLSIESYKYRLPTTSNLPAISAEKSRTVRSAARLSLATEFLDEVSKAHVSDRLDEDNIESGVNTDKSFVSKTAVEVSNLAVGKLINVDINVGDDKTVSVPISIRLATSRMKTDSILHILVLKKDDNTLVERYHAWRSGRIGLIKDLIFCQDLIDEHKKALMHDELGVYSEIVRRVNASKKYGILSNNPSLVSASNIFIISEAVAKELEIKIGGKLSNLRIRERVFENTYAMIIAVVDREWERVTFYHRGISQSTDVAVKDLKGASKDKGQDITDFMKAYSLGNAPQF